jgi:hypothetical protein
MTVDFDMAEPDKIVCTVILTAEKKFNRNILQKKLTEKY